MDEEQRKWYQQYLASFGVREFFRFGCFLIFWISLAGVLTVILKSSMVFLAFFILMFMVAIIAPRWRPAYHLLRLIWGNQNLPYEPYPRSTTKFPRQPLPWLYYVLAIWRWLLALLVSYFIIKFVLK